MTLSMRSTEVFEIEDLGQAKDIEAWLEENTVTYHVYRISEFSTESGMVPMLLISFEAESYFITSAFALRWCGTY